MKFSQLYSEAMRDQSHRPDLYIEVTRRLRERENLTPWQRFLPYSKRVAVGAVCLIVLIVGAVALPNLLQTSDLASPESEATDEAVDDTASAAGAVIVGSANDTANDGSADTTNEEPDVPKGKMAFTPIDTGSANINGDIAEDEGASFNYVDDEANSGETDGTTDIPKSRMFVPRGDDIAETDIPDIDYEYNGEVAADNIAEVTLSAYLTAYYGGAKVTTTFLSYAEFGANGEAMWQFYSYPNDFQSSVVAPAVADVLAQNRDVEVNSALFTTRDTSCLLFQLEDENMNNVYLFINDRDALSLSHTNPSSDSDTADSTEFSLAVGTFAKLKSIVLS
ncbi:MAG: hypothetical protein LBN40_02735 [Oscillospiraceae bacterium]|nr:hypothetical protein [Oscillospiraceae bacterium]